MADLAAPETPAAEADPTGGLQAVARSLRAAALDAPLTPGERAYLGSTATRLEAIADRIRAEAEAPPAEPVRRPETYYTRSEAARVLKLAPNTLLNWEARGLLVPQRDYRGWRVYGRDDLARALALASHVPVADLADHGRERRG
jgi:hypothetical protein